MLPLTDSSGGQSRRETVVSQTPRIGWRLLGNVGCFVAGGMGVTRETGGLLPQWDSSSAAAITTADTFTLLKMMLRERIVIFASFLVIAQESFHIIRF
jgi:hypothetical protein